MSEIKKKIRIKDIAQLAGVSEGTVDRVLHNRGEVSAKSREAVKKALDEMNYTPNLLARSLASKKTYRFVCLFPEHQPSDYWQTISNGFNTAAEEFIQYNVVIQKVYYNQYDVNSFIDQSGKVLNDLPDAVMIAPIFKEETLTFAKKLSEVQVPFSYIDSMIEGAEFVSYYGQHSFQSGFIAAKLLLENIRTNAEILIIRTQRKGAVSNQTRSRYDGFMHYLQTNDLDDQYKLIVLEINDNDDKGNLQLIKETFKQHHHIRGAITFNSKVFRLADYLEQIKEEKVALIGYDLLEKNVNSLKKGTVSYLIAQRPEKQAYFIIRDMCRYLIFKQEISQLNYMPIDILVKENIDYYTHFNE